MRPRCTRYIAPRNVLPAERFRSFAETKSDFIGRDILLKTKENGLREKLVPFKMQGKGPPPRPHYSVFENGERIGEVTSGTQSPSLNWGVGMAYIKASHARIGAT